MKKYLQIYTGNGNRKSDAAFKQAFRMAAYGRYSCIINFGKSRISFDDWSKGAQFWISQITQSEAVGSSAMIKQLKSMLNGSQYSMIILDGILDILPDDTDLLGSLVMLLKETDFRKTVILTGKQCPDELLKMADIHTHTDMVRKPGVIPE